ncbi:tumor susceptibility gene 101 protein-like [Gigantopelta aegis]|uniref:tumor susceptibility gene 101 protein-like n=1 Tax=Gigantopelta aegis TaxID=1735272 RepID=UPI001B88DB45|nr:tumor susceptibility gene 101 protein-like [Gigantopelta aegis]
MGHYPQDRYIRYKNVDATKREVLNVLSQYADLRPQSSRFVFNDGTKKQLLNLEGTIPVPYKGNNYNIPVCIWILDTHPYNPPMVYVRPTPVMQIKPNQYVDANGKVDFPYLSYWKHGSSDLFTMIQMLTVNFSEECPVFSRVSLPQSPVPNPTPDQPGHVAGQPPYPTPGNSEASAMALLEKNIELESAREKRLAAEAEERKARFQLEAEERRFEMEERKRRLDIELEERKAMLHLQIAKK